MELFIGPGVVDRPAHDSEFPCSQTLLEVFYLPNHLLLKLQKGENSRPLTAEKTANTT
jgi:hypothetical protein